MCNSLCHVVLSGIIALDGGGDAENCLGDRALCVKPGAATVNGQATQSAVLPSLDREEYDPCRMPAAHCVSPAARCVQDAMPRCPSSMDPVMELLRRWEAASAGQPAWSARDREWLRRQTGDDLSAHALDLVVRLTQPVAVPVLLHDFDWQFTPSQSTGAVLSAAPRDEAARLFCSELQIELDATTGRLRAVDIVHRATRRHLVIQSEITLAANVSVETDDDSNLPPSPTPVGAAPLIRFAAGAIEIEVE
jgi:hypothetical protein